MEQKPSLCRAVIFVDKNLNAFAATIAHVSELNPGRVSLGCLDEDGNPFSVQSVPFDVEGKPYSWHWPPRV